MLDDARVRFPRKQVPLVDLGVIAGAELISNIPAGQQRVAIHRATFWEGPEERSLVFCNRSGLCWLQWDWCC